MGRARFDTTSIIAHRGPEGWTTQVLPTGSPARSPNNYADLRGAIDVTGTRSGNTDVWVLTQDDVIEWGAHHFDGASWLKREFTLSSRILSEHQMGLVRAHAAGDGLCVRGTVQDDSRFPVGLFWYDGIRWSMCQDSVPSSLPCSSEEGISELAATEEVYDVLEWTDPAWSDEHKSPAQPLLEEWISPEEAYGIAPPDTIMHFDGTSWTRVPATLCLPLFDMVAVGAEIWALGGDLMHGEYGWVGHSDGVSWTWSRIDCDDPPDEIHVSPSGVVYAACDIDEKFLRMLPGGATELLDWDAIGLTESDGIWVEGHTAQRWNGSEWVSYDTGELRRVAAASSQRAWGYEWGPPTIHSFDHGAWSETRFEGNEFADIRAFAEDDVWAVAADKLVHWNGSEWQKYEPGGGVTDFCIDDKGRPWVLARNTVRVLEGGEWSASYVPMTARPTRIACSAERIWVGGSGGPFAWRTVE
ncbi:MAG: hypothetical protein JW940_18805 [Polyangiaceae bacterium]|nr:hypothetical protein [Polyangiaceae bacterium]